MPSRTVFVLLIVAAIAAAGCSLSARPASPRVIFGNRPDFIYNHGFGSVEFQRGAATDGIVGRLVKGEARDGSSDLFLRSEGLSMDAMPVLITPDNLGLLQLGRYYRFFGRIVGDGHKSLVMHFDIIAAEEIDPATAGPAPLEP